MRRLENGAAALRRITALLLLPVTFLAVACDTEELLEVELPGKVPDEALSDAALASTLVAGVVADLECAWDDYVAASAVHSDEFIHSTGNLNNREWAQRRVTENHTGLSTTSCALAYGLYTPLHTARYQAADVYQRLAGFDIANRASLQATVRAYGGYALIALGEGFCEMAIDGGALMTPDQVLALAETWFTEAIELASQSGNTTALNLAYAGRARVNLDLEDFAGAIEDASRIPAGTVINVTRDANDPTRYNTHYELVNGPLGRHASVAPGFRAVTWKGVPDPRVNVFTTGVTGFDGQTVHYIHDKTPARTTPTVLASHDEAQLIIAEASARTGDLQTARDIINALHAKVGIPPLDATDATTQAAMIRQILEERRRELFIEGGHRLNDMLRYRGTEFQIPFLGEPGSDYPNGLDHFGAPYGDTTCWPLPSIEKRGNPNIG